MESLGKREGKGLREVLWGCGREKAENFSLFIFEFHLIHSIFQRGPMFLRLTQVF